MKSAQILAKDIEELKQLLPRLTALEPGLVLVFAAPVFFEDPAFGPLLTGAFAGAGCIGCSTAGEITAHGTHENSCVVTAVRFSDVQIRTASAQVQDSADSRAAGLRLAAQLAVPDLRAVLLWGPGVDINGSELIDGLAGGLAPGVAISGGLAGDNGAFQRTWTLGPQGVCGRSVVAVGLTGAGLKLGHGSYGGWQPFGPARKVTRAQGNILYELDGESALGIYKRYLGDLAKDLPASGLLFPFAMLSGDLEELGLIRTILGVDEEAGSLILAGDVDPNGHLKLMHASTDALIDGAESAAREAAILKIPAPGEGLGILVSCVGRRLVMGARVDEEVDAVSAVLGAGMSLTGFYSYGEIAPGLVNQACKLHNQTMTITVMTES